MDEDDDFSELEAELLGEARPAQTSEPAPGGDIFGADIADPVERFRLLLATRALETDRPGEERARRKALYEAELERRWRRAKPRGRAKFVLTAAEAEMPDAARALVEGHIAAMSALKEGCALTVARCTELMTELAPRVPLERGGPRLFATVHPGEYRSQPAAAKYALTRALIHLEECRAQAGGPEWAGFSGKEQADDAHRVLLYVSEPWMVEAVRLRPGLPMSEWVRLSWQNGCQPRVFWPFLPETFEAEYGLDHFGGRLAPRPEGAPAPAQSSESDEPEPV